MAENTGRRFEVPRQPIAEKEIKETFDTDVVVVGAGTSGKAAALSAVQAGAKVIQIDKHVTYRWGGGMIGTIDSRLQKKLGVKIDKDEVCLQLMRWCGNKPDQRLYRVWADHSGPVMDWLMDITEPEGIKTLPMQWPRPAGWDNSREYYPDYPTAHCHSDGKNIGLNHSLALEIVQKRALDLGVEIRYRTPAVQLVRQPNGRVMGVIARDSERNYLRFNARKAVILCTGDYGNNPWMVQQYCPEAVEVASTRNIYMTRNRDLLDAPEPINVGDGQQMAMAVGAIMEEGFGAPMSHATVPAAGANAFLRVNILGERYENEDVPAQSQANSLVRQPGKKVWQVFDGKWEKDIPRMGFGLGTFNQPNDIIRNNIETNALKGNTLRELALRMDVPFDAFSSTVERINLLAGQGRDPDYGKRPDRLTTVEKPPFYASLVEQHILVVLGGIVTNPRFQALDKDRRVIPGLYMAGNTVGNRFAVDYPTMVAGLSHGFAWVSGRLTGLYAAAET
ncbi:MAG: FAD-dependent oxidoreductase [Dehalococcoidales bacterium]|nr:FAD-dependent oxidoreductase [Dehalococcoidales bacterium]